MPSICMIGNYAQYSGAFEVFRNVARYAKAHGWTTAYLCHASRVGEVVPDLSMFDVAECIEMGGKDRRDYGPELAARANDFDVVHTSLIPQDWRFVFKAHVKRPMVETYHSPDGWKRTWKQFALRLKGCHEKPADAMVGVSFGLSRQIASDMGIECHTIYNGVKIPEHPARGGPYITYCGRISADKGLDDWIRVAMLVREKCPTAKFQWVGALSPQYGEFPYNCLQAATPWIEYRGFVEDVTPYYENSRCLLLTSHSEGLPMTILEAHAHGIPSVAYQVGDIEEAGGRTVKDNDIHAAAFYTGAYLAFDDAFLLDGKDVRTHCVDNFSIEAMGRKYVELYQSVLSRHVAGVAK